MCAFVTKKNLKTWVLCLFQCCNNSEIFDKNESLSKKKKKTVLSGVSNNSNNKIIMFLYRKGIFLSNELFSVSAKLNLEKTAVRFTVSEAVNFNGLESQAPKAGQYKEM